jgi:predicted NUDIX family phosphoesterase
MAEEAGVKLVKLDGSIYRTPEGMEAKTKDDLDDIDPLVAKIYKYTPGTIEFDENRRKVLEEINFFEKYNEMIYYTDYKMDKEIIDIDDIDYTQFRVGLENRNNLEYNGDKFKQLVVGAIVFDVHKNEMYVLKCKGERLKGKLTMVQGHMGLPENVEDVLDLNYANEYNLLKELEEEIGLHKDEILDIETRYCIQSNDNKISSEHMGLISIVYVNTSEMLGELKSGEPEKHDVVKLTYMDVSNLEEVNNMDTWLRKVLIKLKEDIMQ